MLTNRKYTVCSHVEINGINYEELTATVRVCYGAQKGPWYQVKVKEDKNVGLWFRVMGVTHVISMFHDSNDGIHGGDVEIS